MAEDNSNSSRGGVLGTGLEGGDVLLGALMSKLPGIGQMMALQQRQKELQFEHASKVLVDASRQGVPSLLEKGSPLSAYLKKSGLADEDLQPYYVEAIRNETKRQLATSAIDPQSVNLERLLNQTPQGVSSAVFNPESGVTTKTTGMKGPQAVQELFNVGAFPRQHLSPENVNAEVARFDPASLALIGEETAGTLAARTAEAGLKGYNIGPEATLTSLALGIDPRALTPGSPEAVVLESAERNRIFSKAVQEAGGKRAAVLGVDLGQYGIQPGQAGTPNLAPGLGPKAELTARENQARLLTSSETAKVRAAATGLGSTSRLYLDTLSQIPTLEDAGVVNSFRQGLDVGIQQLGKSPATRATAGLLKRFANEIARISDVGNLTADEQKFAEELIPLPTESTETRQFKTQVLQRYLAGKLISNLSSRGMPVDQIRQLALSFAPPQIVEMELSVYGGPTGPGAGNLPGTQAPSPEATPKIGMDLGGGIKLKDLK